MVLSKTCQKVNYMGCTEHVLMLCDKYFKTSPEDIYLLCPMACCLKMENEYK